MVAEEIEGTRDDETRRPEALNVFIEGTADDGCVDGASIKDIYREAADGDEIQVFDGLPLIEEASALKEKGNLCVKQKQNSDAVSRYEEALAVLNKCNGYPMLRSESEQVSALRAALHGNMAQCFLNQQLYRRAVEAATSCLDISSQNAKALHRRSQAHEALKNYAEALRDAVTLQDLDCESLLDVQALEKRCETLWDKHVAKNRSDTKRDEVNAKRQRFQDVVKKYSLDDGEAAAEVAEWLFAGPWADTVDKVRRRWVMDEADAQDFATWIWLGFDFKLRFER